MGVAVTLTLSHYASVILITTLSRWRINQYCRCLGRSKPCDAHRRRSPAWCWGTPTLFLIISYIWLTMMPPLNYWVFFLDQCLSDRQRQTWFVEIARINHLRTIDPALSPERWQMQQKNGILRFVRGSVSSPIELFKHWRFEEKLDFSLTVTCVRALLLPSANLDFCCLLLRPGVQTPFITL